MIEEKDIEYEKTILIGLITQKQDEAKSVEYLDELEFLAFTAGGEVLKRFVQKMEKPNPKTFIGTGKLEEVLTYVQQHGVGTVIFDDELSAAQQKNIEKIKKKLHENRYSEPLFDTKKYTKHLEEAFFALFSKSLNRCSIASKKVFFSFSEPLA